MDNSAKHHQVVRKSDHDSRHQSQPLGSEVGPWPGGRLGFALDPAGRKCRDWRNEREPSRFRPASRFSLSTFVDRNRGKIDNWARAFDGREEELAGLIGQVLGVLLDRRRSRQSS